MKNRSGPEDELFKIGIIVFFAGGLLMLLFKTATRYLPPIPCLFSAFLGIYCPGCGGTRAVEALFHGHFLLSLWYHPLVPYTAVIYCGFMLSHILNKLGVKKIHGWKFHNWYLYAAVGIIVVNFLVKNVLRICFGITM